MRRRFLRLVFGPVGMRDRQAVGAGAPAGGQCPQEGADCRTAVLCQPLFGKRLQGAPGNLARTPDREDPLVRILEAVDYVVVFDEATPHRVIETVRPDLLVKGGTYKPEEIVGKEVVESYGGEVRALGEVPGSAEIETVRQPDHLAAAVLRQGPGS